MPSNKRISFLPAGPLGAALLALGACLAGCGETTVDPFVESDRRYSLYGTLDMNRDTQYVRVVPIRKSLEDAGPQPLGASFVSTDLTTGLALTWRDSVVAFPDGSYGHVFYRPLRIEAGHDYRVEVRSADSEIVTSAQTSAPPLVRSEVEPEKVVGSMGSGGVQGVQRVVFRGAPRQPFRIELWYRFMPAEGAPFLDIALPYEPRNSALGGGDWEVTLDLVKDRLTLDTLLDVRNTTLGGLGLRLTLLDAAFAPPGGVFDREILAQPGVLDNVENGFGFVGSVGRFSAEWLLSDAAQMQLAYRRRAAATVAATRR